MAILRYIINKLKVYSEFILVFRVSKAKWDPQDLLESLDLRYVLEVFLLNTVLYFNENHYTADSSILLVAVCRYIYCITNIMYSFVNVLLFLHLFLHSHCPSLHPSRVHQERQVHWESVATPGLQDPLESRVYQVLQGRRAPRETLVPQAAPARTDPQDLEASLGREGCPALL